MVSNFLCRGVISASFNCDENFLPDTTSIFQISASGSATMSAASFNIFTGMFLNVPAFLASRLFISVIVSVTPTSVKENLFDIIHSF